MLCNLPELVLKINFTCQEAIFSVLIKSGNIPRTPTESQLYPFFCLFRRQQVFLRTVRCLANIVIQREDLDDYRILSPIIPPVGGLLHKHCYK